MITTGNGTFELIDNEYIEFNSYSHVTGSKLKYLKQDVAAFEKILKGRKVPIISIIPHYDKMDSESEKYIRNELPKYFTKMAIFSSSRWTFYLFKLVSSFLKFPVPSQIFHTKEDALIWIRD